MALILSGRHPDARYKNYMLDWLASNCPAEVVQLAEAIFLANVRACFRSDDASSSSSLQRVLVYALLIAKEERPEMLASFAEHNGLFERDCFEQPVVQKLLNRLRKMPLYPYAEANTTNLSYLHQGRFAHYEVNRATGALECIEFVKKPTRVVCGPLQEEDVGGEVDGECGGDNTNGANGVKKKFSKKHTQNKADEDIDALAEGVIALALDSSEEDKEEDREKAEAGDAVEAQDNRYGSCLAEGSPGDSNNKSSARKCADVDVNGVVEVEAAFAARLGYDRATNAVHLTDVTDAFMSDVLVALQCNGTIIHADLCASCCARYSGSGKNKFRMTSQHFNCGPKPVCTR